jgi:hypothetical protein
MKRLLICLAVGLGLLFSTFTPIPASAHYYHHGYHHRYYHHGYYHHRHHRCWWQSSLSLVLAAFKDLLMSITTSWG